MDLNIILPIIAYTLLGINLFILHVLIPRAGK